ncbi:6-phospho-beta-galactosidase [Carnobacterium gallinarum]|uniref:6-phospho-beta-galactosidase n=1 Tax=Carnobacterium gallinarum TaxID=2749 RepID=UPI000550719F|nr:6-phospho-beta-galactosidase [Carnobacterium gallinarum]
MELNLPQDFILGAATAAYQAEGALNEGRKGKTYWDAYLAKQGIFDPSTASDFYHQYPHDLALAREFGLNGIRISIAWSRIFPAGTGEINPEGIAFYHQLIDSCLANGVEPFVTLHHFDTPEPLFLEGDWLNRENLNHFVAFAKVCFEEYGHKVKKWITINEPWSVVAGQYIIGHFPPNIHYDIPKAVQAMHHMMVAHAKVVELYKSLKLSGEIGIVHILESKYPISSNEADQQAAYLEDLIANRFMLDATFKGNYEPETLKNINDIVQKNNGELVIEAEDLVLLASAAKLNDFLGVNYYASHFLKAYRGESQIQHNGTGEKGSSIFALKGVGQRVTNPAIPTTDWDWPIYPQGLTDMLIRIKQDYPNYQTLYVTENGMGYKDELIAGTVDDTPRIEYIQQHLGAISTAINAGVNVKGYFLWSLMDVFSWTNGYNKRYGLLYVDFATQERFPKKSAYWFKELADTKKRL